MSERFYWGLAALVTAGLIFVGVQYFQPALTALHIIACGILILVVLLQSGRAADLAGAFGGAGSQTAFGPRGAATLLSKATTFLAVVFMLTSLALAIFAGRGPASSVVQPEPAPVEQPAETPPPADQQQPPPGGQQQPPPETPPPSPQ